MPAMPQPEAYLGGVDRLMGESGGLEEGIDTSIHGVVMSAFEQRTYDSSKRRALARLVHSF